MNWFQMLVFAIVVNSLCMKAEAICTDGKIPDSYRKLATDINKNSPQADLVKMELNGKLGYQITTGKVNPNKSLFAAFFLPPVMTNDLNLAKTIARFDSVTLEEVSSNNSEILDSPWNPGEGALLILPASADDCQYWLVQEGVILNGSISDFLDSIFASQYPESKERHNILLNGIDDPILAWKFARTMSLPIMVSADSTVLGQFPKVSALSLPDLLIWMHAIEQFGWPAELKALSGRSMLQSSTALEIISRSLSQMDKEQISQDMNKLHELVIRLKVLGEPAKESLDLLKAINTDTWQERDKYLWGTWLQSMEREWGNSYEAQMMMLQTTYTNLYQKMYPTIQANNASGLDIDSILSYRPNVEHPERFSGWEVKKLPKWVPTINGRTDKLKTYIYFPAIPDAESGEVYLKPTLIAALPFDGIEQEIQSLAQQQLQKNNSCGTRFSAGPLSFSLDWATLRIGGSVQVDQWACVTHDWICFKGWKPSICKNHIKTHLFKTHANIDGHLNLVASNDTLKVNYSYNIPMYSYYEGSKSYSFKPEGKFSLLDETLTLDNVFFAHESKSRKIYIVVQVSLGAKSEKIANGYLSILHNLETN